MQVKEKCFREINDTLAKTISQSILKQFASNLGVEIYQGKQIKKQSQKVEKEHSEDCKSDKFDESSDERSVLEDLTEEQKEKHASIQEFEKMARHGDNKGMTKLIKSLTIETEQDIHMNLRQKNGQLRFGDVITINYQKEIFDKTDHQQHPVSAKFRKSKHRAQKNLFDPDYVYHGLLYSDGVTDSGIKMIPKASACIQNACNLFKQCLFRIEVQQSCEVNVRRKNLLGQKQEHENKLKKIIKDKGGEGMVRPEMILQIKKDIEKIDDEIMENEAQKLIEEENNRYLQELNRGKKLTYGTPIQLYHLFSGKYLTLNLNQMSSEHGSCELELHQTTDQSQWLIEPSEQISNTAGYVVSYQDYFNIKSLNTTSNFCIHVYEKGSQQNGNQKSFNLSASSMRSPLKARLFMTFGNAEQEKSGIQSGDVIRLKSFEANSYITTQLINVDSLLPCLPDFLKNQIRRMQNLEQVERNPGGKEKASLTKQEREFQKQDMTFKLAMINDEYVKQLKSKQNESLFVEQKNDRIKFTNSCWEIQRVNSLNGANLILEEIVRFRHVGTGKFLCIGENGIDLTLTGGSNNLDCLFLMKSDMSNNKPTKFLDEDGDGQPDPPKHVAGKSKVLVQAWKSERYLQVVGDCKKQLDVEELSESDMSDEDLNTKQEDMSDSQLRVASGDFQKQEKNKMVFYIEEVDTKDSIYSYQCACMFDELLEFYCFLNQYGVSKLDLDEYQEKFTLKLPKIQQSVHVIAGKVQKMEFILSNIEIRIQDSSENQRTDEMLVKCKDELSDQGLLDILFCIVEMLYYKTTPPSLFEKVFKSNTKEQKEKDKLDKKAYKMTESIGQQIIRDETSPLLNKILEIILKLVNDHQNNSEKSSKYFGILLQQYRAQESYKQLMKIHPSFKLKYNPNEIMLKIGQILSSVQRICTFVIPDRNLYELIDQEQSLKKLKRQQTLSQSLKKSKTMAVGGGPANDTMGFFQPVEKSINPKLIDVWVKLLQPVRHINKSDSNIHNQIMYLNILANFCQDKASKGVFPYQKHLSELILKDESKFFLKFGTAKVEGALRPYIYFCRPAGWSRQMFLEDNPILGEIHDTNYMTQHNNQKAQYDLIFDAHSLTEKFNDIKIYVDYICAVVNLYACMSQGGNNAVIDMLSDVGLSESHISLILHKDTSNLTVHEKLKTSYCYLARVMFIENDSILNCIENKNRCYVWDRIKKSVQSKDNGFSQNNFEDLVVNDEYAGKTKTKVTQLDDGSQSMVVLTEDQKLQNKMVISLLKESALWFFLEGPKGTNQFFYHNSRRNFMPESLEIKMHSVLQYLNMVYSIVNKDFIDDVFIQNITIVCTCVLYGSLNMPDAEEQTKGGRRRKIDAKNLESNIPLVVRSNWVYNLMWISKTVVKTNPGIYLEKSNYDIECRTLDILDKLACNKLNSQVMAFLTKFRQFQETSLDPELGDEENIKTFDVENEFESIFDASVQDSMLEQLETVKNRQHTRMHHHTLNCKQANCVIRINLEEFEKRDEAVTQNIKNDIFMNYIFNDSTKQNVRRKALEVMIKEFNQKELLVNELMKTSLIVSNDDYHTHIKFLLKQRFLKTNIQQMLHNEVIWAIQDENQPAPGQTQEVIYSIKKIIVELGNDIKGFDDVKKRRFQNMIRHIGMIEQLNTLMIKLKEKMFYYRELYQEIINFFYIVCFNNPIVQGYLLKDLNFFVDMINNRINTGILISEVIKCNLKVDETHDFIAYLVNKIINEGYFKSQLFYLLIKLASGQSNSSEGEGQIARNQNDENSNQQYIMKQIVKNDRFRQLIYMQPQLSSTKLGIIKCYHDKIAHAHLNDKDNEYFKRDKELLDIHLAVIDLVSICAKNSPYGVSQAQNLINVDELQDSILSDAIPYLVKRHYFNLLFEVYLRKVPGIDQIQRIPINNFKLQNIFKWVICWDLDQCYNHYSGLVIDAPINNGIDENKRFRQVNREVQRLCEQEFEDKYISKTDEERINENLTRSKLQAFSDKSDQFFLDESDLTEYWRYLYETTEAEGSYTGLLSLLENFYKDYTKKDLDEDLEAQKNTGIIKQKLLEIASNIFLIQDTHDDYIKVQSQQILVQINRTVQQMPRLKEFYMLNEELDTQQSSLATDQVDNRMCGDKIIEAICQYVLKENIPIREALGISSISSENTMVSKDSLKKEIKLICGSSATYDEVVKGLEHFHCVSSTRKQIEAGTLDYIVKDEVGLDLIDIVDIEVRLREVLLKEGKDADNLGGDSAGVVQVEEAIHDQDLSNAINIDLKLFSQRFFEFVRGTKNFSEIHTFVHDLMSQEHLKDRDNKVKFVRSLCDGFTGLSGDNDELILISILSLIIQRLIPDEEDSLQVSNQTLLFVKKSKKHNDRLKHQLKEWQNIMFDADVPALMLSFINMNNDPYLSNKALGLLNNILIRTNEVNQNKIVQLLKKDDCFFDVFYYLSSRMQASKEFMLDQIQKSAEQKFLNQNMQKKKKGSENKQNDFQNPRHLLNMKYDLEVRYKELISVWKQEEMYEILKFLNSMCEGCYEPAQLFLGTQQNDVENFKDQKKITSIDLVYEVQRTFIDIVDTMGDYVFSDFRTFKLIPLMMDTMLEFIYGPCVRNQVFLGESKKFISVINTLIDQAEMGNYSGIHQQAKAQLVILSSCTQLLLAICDIKDPVKAERTHQIILNEIDLPNLVKKMKDIYIFKIGGDPEKQMVYDFNMQCNHYKSAEDSGKSRCLENEFCEFKHFIPRDINTIQTGFNIYMILTILKNHNPNRKEINIFKRHEGEYNSLVQKQGKALRHRIFEKYKMSSEKTKNIYERFNKIEVVLLDQMIIKSFPEMYITYIEQTIEEQKEDPNQEVDYQLKSYLDKAKCQKNKFDQQQILKKLPDILRKNYTDGKSDFEDVVEEPIYHEDTQSNFAENEKLISSSSGQDHQFEGKVIPVNKQNQVDNTFVYEKNKNFYEVQIEEERIIEEKLKFDENVKKFEFYLAGNFFDDNITSVEIKIEQIEGRETYSPLSSATFQIPSFIQHLTLESRNQITTTLTGVSQQEKLESFVEQIPMNLIEMKWQQRLGRVSYALKIFANQWDLLSWINFYIICFINVMLVAFFTVEPVEAGRDDKGNQIIEDKFKIPNEQINEIVNDIGLIQTTVAGIVVIAYYIEYRAKLKYKIQESKQQQNIDLEGFGENYGSQGYGLRKSGKLNDIKSEQFIEVNPLRGIENKSVVFKIFMIFTKEVSMFIKAISYDKNHLRNITYVVIACASSLPNAQIAYSVLLLDILNKVQILGQVISVISDNIVGLGSVGILFLVLLYLYAFFAFTYVRTDYRQNFNTGSNDYQNHAPVSPGGTYNMDCSTLINCLMSTSSFGMRSGGGIGDALWQRFESDEYYQFRWMFDFSFFMIINVILMNIFFGIIIDSFADKRQGAADIMKEVEGQCFICGISKSKFEIENISWADHVYTEHNLHAYLSFIIYVQGKNMSECSGVEKWVKKCLDDDNIDFFPINQCSMIRNGEELD